MYCSRCGNAWEDVTIHACPECGAEVLSEEGEDSYTAGVVLERQGKYKSATAHYSLAADLGNPCAAYSVCRTMEKSGEAKKNVRLYEFWLSYAAEEDAIAAYAYGLYLRKKKEEQLALRYLILAAEKGHDGAALQLGKYYFRHGNRPGARYYFGKVKGFTAALMRLMVKKGATYPPAAPELPDNSVELHTTGEYALELGLPHVAFTYFDRAAKASYLPSVRMVADMCMKGRGTIRSDERVEACLMILGENGDTASYLRLGEYWESGMLGGAPNSRAAFQKYMLAAEAGDAEGMLLVGDFLYDGNGVERNIPAAIEWYEKAAAAGNAIAVNRNVQIRKKAEQLVTEGAIALANGEGQKAFLHFSGAIPMGNTDAMVYMGDCYMLGRGCKKSPKTAASYYLAAAENNNPMGKYRLGVLYMNNMGVPFSAKKAKEYLTQAVAEGISKAQVALDLLHKRKQAYLAQKVYSVSCAIYHRGDSALAAKFRHVATKMGHGRAGYLLGCMYDCGDGVAKDPMRAKALHEQALRRGFDGQRLGWLAIYLRHMPRA